MPHDDREAIPDDSFVYRSVPATDLPSNDNGGKRLGSGAFSASRKDRDPYEGMSVDAGPLMEAAGVPEISAKKTHHPALVRLQAGRLRALGCLVGTDNLPNNPYHAQVWGVGNKSRRIRKAAEWVIRPADVDEVV